MGEERHNEMIESVNGRTTELYAELSDRKELMRLLNERNEVVDFEAKGLRRDGRIVSLNHWQKKCYCLTIEFFNVFISFFALFNKSLIFSE